MDESSGWQNGLPALSEDPLIGKSVEILRDE